MKLLILCLAILGVATASAIPAANVHSRTTRGSLEEDFQDFVALIPLDKVIEILIQYVAEDKEVQEVVEYIQSDAFKALVLAVENIPEYIRFLNYLQKNGLDVYRYVNLLHELLGLEPLKPTRFISVSPLASTRITGGVAGLIADIRDILPIDAIIALYNEKLENSASFAEFFNILGSEEARKVYRELQANQEYQFIKGALKDKGLDVDAVIAFLAGLLGIY